MKNPYAVHNNKELSLLLKKEGADLNKNIIKYNEMLWIILQRNDAKLAYEWATIIGTELEAMCDIILNSGNYIQLDNFLSQVPQMHDRIYSYIISHPVNFYTFSWICHKPLDNRTPILKKKVIAEGRLIDCMNYLYVVYTTEEVESYDKFFENLDDDARLGVLI